MHIHIVNSIEFTVDNYLHYNQTEEPVMDMQIIIF